MGVQVEEEENGAAEFSNLSCVSVKSDHSKGLPLNFSEEAGPAESQ